MSSTPSQAARPYYPGLLPREGAILKAWLAVHESEYDRFDYNVRVGPGSDPGPRYSDALRQQAIQNSQLRIDAVGWQGSQPTIIEVKENAGTSALGQLLTYNAHWQAAYPSGPAPKLLLATDRLNTNVAIPLQAHGITYDVVLPDYTGLPGPPGS
jgi:hypothetical protein